MRVKRLQPSFLLKRAPEQSAKTAVQSADPSSVQFLNAIGRALLKQRLALGLTQQQVAEAIGIQPESVSRIEHGLIAPTLSRLRQFAQLYDCSVTALIGEASDHMNDLANKLARELVDLAEIDRQFVVAQMVALARHLRSESRARGHPTTHPNVRLSKKR